MPWATYSCPLISGVELDTLQVPSNLTNSSDFVNLISCNLLVEHYIHNY